MTPAEVSAQFLAPTRTYPRSEILARPCPVPASPGLYAWFFSPGSLPVPDFDGTGPAYVGISPSRLREGGTAGLRSRLRAHLRGNASASTLRLTLGLLLSQQLGIRLQPTASGRLTFGAGETLLNCWLEEHARVTWVEHLGPWTVESSVVAALAPPLNLDHNRHHPFFVELHRLRSEARRAARTPQARPTGPLLGKRSVSSDELIESHKPEDSRS